VIVCFVDIGGIDDHYCLNFPFCVQLVKMKGGQVTAESIFLMATSIDKTNNYSSP
jgi:hypothetical protein